ncbi:hypothetical protein GCM10020000_35020 [Streptomyces olivoverticillatus]
MITPEPVDWPEPVAALISTMLGLTAWATAATPLLLEEAFSAGADWLLSCEPLVSSPTRAAAPPPHEGGDERAGGEQGDGPAGAGRGVRAGVRLGGRRGAVEGGVPAVVPARAGTPAVRSRPHRHAARRGDRLLRRLRRGRGVDVTVAVRVLRVGLLVAVAARVLGHVRNFAPPR